MKPTFDFSPTGLRVAAVLLALGSLFTFAVFEFDPIKLVFGAGLAVAAWLLARRRDKSAE
jgi:hypothetical protein